jgi:hypothetical protein
MIELKLQADTPELQRIKDYLQENASETLADKINNGTPFEKDGKPLIKQEKSSRFYAICRRRSKETSRKECKIRLR